MAADSADAIGLFEADPATTTSRCIGLVSVAYRMLVIVLTIAGIRNPMRFPLDIRAGNGEI